MVSITVVLAVLAITMIVAVNGFMLAPKLIRAPASLASSRMPPAGGGSNKDLKYNSITSTPRQPTPKTRQEVSSAQRTWRSGNALVTKRLPENPNGRRRNDPWWMREDEKNNPRILPVHKPWWLGDYKKVDSSWKVPELKAEADRRGLSSKGLKSDLIARLQEAERRYSLTDENFTPPVFVPLSGKELNGCYPDVYESGVVAAP